MTERSAKTEDGSRKPEGRGGYSATRFLLPASCFLLALVVRCIGLRWGLPNATQWYSYHPDEFQTFVATMNLDFFGGDFNPNFFNYPSLFLYLTYIAYGVMGVLGLTHPPAQSQSQLWMPMHDVMLCGRVVSAVLGAATAPLVFLIARQIGGLKIGVLAALLFALVPGHVQHSHFATVDVASTFFVALCLWLSTRALENKSQKTLLLAALVAGLAAATKYNAGLVLIAPLTTWFWLWRDQRLSISAVFAIIALCGVGFLIGCPYAVLDFPSFWGDGQNSGFAYELLVHPRQGHGDVFINTGNGWLYHLFFNAPFLMGLPLLMGALLGIASTRFTAPRREVTLLFIWVALYFFALGFSQVRFMRYLLPLVPALCVFAACGVLALKRPVLRKIGAYVLLVCAAWSARDVLYPFIATDPRDQAVRWMSANASTPTIGMISPPWFWSPPFSPLDSPPFRPASPSQLSQLTGGKYQFVFTDNAAALRAQLPEYFVLSELEWREKARLNDPTFLALEQELALRYSAAATFKNHAPFALPGRDFVPHDFLYTNSEITIYRRP